MSYQQQEFTAPGGPVRRESALQRQMAEFDAKKAASTRSVSYTEETREGSGSPNSKSSKRNGTPHPKASGPHAPPSPEREQGYVELSRKNTNQSPPRSDDETDHSENIRKTGGNGRDSEVKWVGKDLPRPRVHVDDQKQPDMSHADSIKVTGGRGKDQTIEWDGEEAPRITTHHVWTDDEPRFEGESKDDGSAPRKKNIKSKKYKDASGDYVEEADGSDNEVNAHHVWKPDSAAQAAYKPEKVKKSKKSSRKSSRENNDYAQHSGDERSGSGGVRTYIDSDGDEVQEAEDPDNLKMGHNHVWTE